MCVCVSICFVSLLISLSLFLWGYWSSLYNVDDRFPCVGLLMCVCVSAHIYLKSHKNFIDFYVNMNTKNLMEFQLNFLEGKNTIIPCSYYRFMRGRTKLKLIKLENIWKFHTWVLNLYEHETRHKHETYWIILFTKPLCSGRIWYKVNF